MVGLGVRAWILAFARMTSAGDRQERQSFRTKRDRDIELITPLHTYDNPGRYSVAVKVIDIFGNDTTTVVPVTVG